MNPGPPSLPTLSRRLARILSDREWTLSTAESCTGGLLASTLTDIPGASRWFPGGVVAYDNRIKTAWLDVPQELLCRCGAVSAPVAAALAQGARERFGSTFALATTGIAGPGGGTARKPVGLVYIAIATTRKILVRKCFFSGTRRSIKRQATRTALGLLSQHLHPY